MSDDLVLRREELDSAAARSLIAALNAELAARYPEEGATHFRLEEDEVASGRGAFLVTYRHDVPVGCGAVRMLDASTAEIKRMFVTPAARGEGLGRRMLEALESEARGLGASRVVLETGTRQAEALELYTSAGYARIPPFGEYVGSPTSVCFGKDL